ncbi:MAG: Hsp90 protein-domain-containing protein [Monoraphidium minutum]|nr:MAG: Hsp90 protein-domain-containing protein [Monoraphidium minutum]
MRAAHAALLAGLLVAFCSAGALAASADATIDMSATPKVQKAAGAPATGTDAGTVEREAESMNSPASQRKARAGAREYKFEAEVSRMMDIIIHSLYSNKDIFLRELISNASDALDKIRFLSLTDKSVLGEGDTAKLEIKIWLDPVNKILYMRDRGIGMTQEEMVKNLGTIARSGTSAFLEQMQKGGDMSLIGQFGVGFYSVYLVADWVEVVSKHNDDKQWIWSSDAGGSFNMAEDKGENEDLGRGTLVKIHLKPEAMEYAEEAKLRDLVRKYSEFINFPIYMETEKEVDVPVEEEEDETKDEAAKDDSKDDDKKDDEDDDEDGDVVDDDEEESKDEEKKPKTRKEKVKEWDLLNDIKAIWLRTSSDVTDEEYQKFYKTISKDYDEASGWVHFKAEGDVEFKALVFIPKRAPYGFFDRFYDKKQESIKLYVRRVFISDEVDDLLPKWLSFLKGLVDSDTLPLNVSREMLQAHSSLKTIRKKLVRKVLDYIKRMADDEAKCGEKGDDGDKEGDDKDEAKKDGPECSKYSSFWKEFGRAIKLGIIEDTTNRVRLAKLLRFHTSKSPDTLTSLDEYIGRMPEGQKQIYWISAGSKEEAAKSPFLERLVKKGYEVMYLVDVLDEYVMGQLTEYEDLKLINISKEDLKVGDEKESSLKDLKEQYAPLTKWWKDKLAGKVSTVKVSNRLSTTPCVVVASKFGQTANMERIMKAQALGDSSANAYMRSQRSLEINPHHPLIKGLLDRIEADADDATAGQSASLLFETALLESGYSLDDPKDFATRMYKVLGGEMGLKGDLAADEADAVEAEAEAKAKAKAEAKDDDEDDEDDEDEGVKVEL